MLVSYAYFSVFCIFLISTLLYLLRLVFQKPLFSALGLRVLMLGAFLLAVTLVYDFSKRPTPFTLGYHDYYHFSAFIVALVFVVLSFTKKFFAAGPFAILAIDLFCVMSFQTQNPLITFTGQKGVGYLFLHFGAIFLSLAVLAIALVTGIMYFLTLFQLQNKKSIPLIRKFPALSVLESTHFNAIKWLFILLTVVIMTGAGYSKIKTGQYFHSDAKLWLTLLSWIVFAVLLNFRNVLGLRGQKGFLVSTLGLGLVLLLFFVGMA